MASEGRFPDIDLPDHNGIPRQLSQVVGGDPCVLQFYRGFWCPKDQAFFRRLIAFQELAEVAYTSFVSVSVDEPRVAAAFRAGLGARWTFLSDHERSWIERLGLRESTDTKNDPYRPVVYVLKPDLTIHSEYNGYWFWGRPTLDELHRDLRDVTMEVRDDWMPPAP